MELWTELLAHCLSHEDVQFIFPNLQLNAFTIVEGTCYLALKQIKEILEDASFSDQDCYLKIEEIIQTMESIGIDTGFRHDF